MNDVDLAIAVAQEGATVVRRCFGTSLRRLDKGGGDFATSADIDAENAMLAVLHRERPEDRILGEESGVSGTGGSPRTWLIDPLCRRADGDDVRLVPSGTSKLVDLNLDPPFPNAPAFRAVTLAADPDFVATFRPRVVSTSMALAWVATGQRAAYITDSDLRDSVHFAAGLALCEAAGCTVTDLRGRS
jgi:myo-inositol-1(or 4)-monophosphatase